jgi:hypothetical protein
MANTNTITRFRCLLISPGDVQEERDAISDVFLRWNAHEGQAFEVYVALNRWEIGSTPALGDRPQEIINRQIVDESDFGIALFWSRLGTPTGQFPSGSAEEITRLAISQKQVMVYFKTAPIPQTSTEEFQRLRPFREELKSSGLCEDFEDIGLLREKISHHITTAVTKLLRSQPNQSPATIAPKTPKLVNLVDPFVYQMRHNVYDGLHEFLGKIMVDLKLDMADIAKLHKLREESEFLFGTEVVAYIREWIKRAAGMKVGRDIIDDRYTKSPEHQGWVQVYNEACQYFVHQFEPLTDIFRPYLTIPLE